jgi:predicted naringenin-chalcone synthase
VQRNTCTSTPTVKVVDSGEKVLFSTQRFNINTSDIDAIDVVGATGFSKPTLNKGLARVYGKS